MKKAQVVKFFGRPKDLADALKITPGSISQWGEVIPEKQALRLERITKGKLKYDSSFYQKSA